MQEVFNINQYLYKYVYKQDKSCRIRWFRPLLMFFSFVSNRCPFHKVAKTEDCSDMTKKSCIVTGLASVQRIMMIRWICVGVFLNNMCNHTWAQTCIYVSCTGPAMSETCTCSIGNIIKCVFALARFCVFYGAQIYTAMVWRESSRAVVGRPRIAGPGALPDN